MRQNLTRSIVHFIQSRYYKIPTTDEIIAYLRKSNIKDIEGLDDFQLSNIISQTSSKVNYTQLTFKKSIAETYFSSNRGELSHSRISEIIAKYNEKEVQENEAISEIFALLQEYKYVDEQSGEYPAIENKDTLFYRLGIF